MEENLDQPVSNAVSEKDEMPYLIVEEPLLPGGSTFASTTSRIKAQILCNKILNNQPIFVTMRHPTTDGSQGLKAIGVLAKVLLMGTDSNGETSFQLEGLERARVKGGSAATGLPDNFALPVEPYPYLDAARDDDDPHVKARAEKVCEIFLEIYKLRDHDQSETAMMGAETPTAVAQVAAGSLSSFRMISRETLQSVLETDDLGDRLKMIQDIGNDFLQQTHVKSKIDRGVSEKMSHLREIDFLRLQKRIINENLKELGDPELLKENEDDDLAELKAKLAAAKLPDDVRKRVEKELKNLSRIPPASAEYSISMKYLEAMAEMPWGIEKQMNTDLRIIKKRLDEALYGMDDVKNVMLEHTAVQISNPNARTKPVNLVGPPGVGKTSIGQAYADSLGLEFYCISLGGESNESKIRGHSRTYVGAMMGQIAKAIRNAKSANPVIMLDEIDKLLSSPHGDPAAALLEVLDPAQNHKFKDNYLDESFDLSRVRFICTANDAGKIPLPLLDRVENVFLDGYMAHEKLKIAREYLLPRQMKECGLTPDKISVSDEALRDIIQHYTKEAGVRKLNESIGILCRRVNLALLEGSKMAPVTVTSENLSEIIGEHKVDRTTIAAKDQIGVMTGLYYSETGGGILTIEAMVEDEGKGDFTASGNLQGSMKESIEYIKHIIPAHANEFRIDLKDMRTKNMHVHFPAAATPKDGPSAGAATTIALLSAILGRKIRRDVAMTGEISGQKYILAIGGLKEKFDGAVEAGVKTVIIPKANVKDLAKIPDEIKSKLEIIAVDRLEDALPYVFADAAGGQLKMMGRVGRQFSRPTAGALTGHDRVPSPAIQQPVLQ